MAKPAAQSDAIKPWTIKGIPSEERNGAISAAGREKQPLGEWIARAIRSQIQADRQQDRSPAVVGPEVKQQADLIEIERTVALIRDLASAGAPPPKTVSRLAYGVLKTRLMDLRGPTKSGSGRTKSGSGPTLEAEGPTEAVEEIMADADV